MSVWIVTYEKRRGAYGGAGHMLVFAKTPPEARAAARKRAHQAGQEADNFEAFEIHPDEHAGRAFEDLVGAWAAAKATRDRLAQAGKAGRI